MNLPLFDVECFERTVRYDVIITSALSVNSSPYLCIEFYRRCVVQTEPCLVWEERF